MPHIHLTNVAGFDAVLGEIRDAMVATGDWTIHADLTAPDEGAGAGGRQLIASNGDVLAGLRSTTTGNGANRLYLFDGIPPAGAGTLDTLPGNSGIRYTDAAITSITEPSVRHLQKWPGPFPNAHIFTNDPSTYIHVAIEISSGIWKHMMFGNLIKFGTWTGGGYYACQSWSQNEHQINSPGSIAHLFPFDNNYIQSSSHWTLHYEDGGAGQWITPGGPYTLNGVNRQGARGGFRGGTGYLFKAYRESPFSGRIPLAPVLLQRLRTEDTPDTIRWVGQVPDIRMLNITNLAPAESLMIGADEYIVFPLVAKNGIGSTNFNSGTEGIAYLVRP